MDPGSEDESPLFWLPDELLKLVVEQALADGVPADTLLRTSDCLARIVREVHHPRIVYGGEKRRYDKVVKLMERRPDLRELVRDLTVTPVFEDGEGLADYSWLYPGTARILIHFPSVQILRIIGASADQLAEILVAPLGPILPPLQHLTIELSPANAKSLRDSSWWKALPRFHDLAELTLQGRGSWSQRRRFQVVEQAEPKGCPRMPGLDRVHTLTIRQLAAPTEGATTFANDLPALNRLILEDQEPMMISRWLEILPLTLTHVALSLVGLSYMPDSVSRQLGRFPHSRHLSLSGAFGLHSFVPFLRQSQLSHIELQSSRRSALSLIAVVLFGLVSGPDRMKHLRVLHPSPESPGIGTNDQDLKTRLHAAIKGSSPGVTVAGLKHSYEPFRGAASAVQDVQRLVDAGRSNGIKIAGSALRCLDWEQHFDDLVECCFVEHALSTNDFTILDREYGKEGANEAIRRQRPLLAARLSGDGS